MANAGVPAGKSVKMVDTGAGKVNVYPDSKTNEIGVPYGQTPGLGKGNKEVSMNQLPANAKVIYCSKSDLMTGMSQNRGPGGTK